ncbi:PASTA domain-containing protein [Pseudonocardia sp. MH-G8]|uniref:PASTA domain-containing protein n=1 Tax=Pseudonocardia sp. MH-G8 TaxID=1854588 RepID=UPI000BA169E5|nr:PASTA domain-containing protein [Pseudonocardia sp. MH-G8]OZM77245.1 PASTA domain protein [Pseudonocardia sp. MH-G8]
MADEEHVLVPAMIGLDIVDAQALALAARVVTVTEDPDLPPPLSGVVVDQQPAAGTQVFPGEPVTIWVEEKGGGGGSAPLDPGPLQPAGTRFGP